MHGYVQCPRPPLPRLRPFLLFVPLPGSSSVLPQQHCRLAKPVQGSRLFTFPRALNLIGPPYENGRLIITARSLGNEDTTGGGAAAASPAMTAGARASEGRRVEGSNGRQLRLAVSMRAGPPAKVLIRSRLMNAGEEFSSEIRATLLAGFKVYHLCIWICLLCSCVWFSFYALVFGFLLLVAFLFKG